MKKLILPLLAVLTIFVSCSSGGDNIPERYEKTFYGSLLLNGSPVTTDAKCGLYIIADIAAVTLHDLDLGSGNMGDMIISNLACVKTSDGFVATGNNIIPFVGDVKYNDLKISKVELHLSGDKLTVEAKTPRGTIMFSNAFLTPIKPAGGASNYSGSLLVGDFVNEGIKVGVVKNEAASTLELVINDVRFAEGMPVKIDITLKDIPYTVDGGIKFDVTDVLPYINTEQEPAQAYAFASVAGEIEGNSLYLTAQMADNLAPYLAGKVFEYSGVKITE